MAGLIQYPVLFESLPEPIRLGILSTIYNHVCLPSECCIRRKESHYNSVMATFTFKLHKNIDQYSSTQTVHYTVMLNVPVSDIIVVLNCRPNLQCNTYSFTLTLYMYDVSFA